jgi:hypothetical protein
MVKYKLTLTEDQMSHLSYILWKMEEYGKVDSDSLRTADAVNFRLDEALVPEDAPTWDLPTWDFEIPCPVPPIEKVEE